MDHLSSDQFFESGDQFSHPRIAAPLPALLLAKVSPEGENEIAPTP
jgi:hypothetical protein